MNQMNLRDSYRIFHQNIKDYIFFSAPHGTFSKTDHILEMHPIRLPRIKGGYQQQKEQKVYKLTETEQLSTE